MCSEVFTRCALAAPLPRGLQSRLSVVSAMHEERESIWPRLHSRSGRIQNKQQQETETGRGDMGGVRNELSRSRLVVKLVPPPSSIYRVDGVDVAQETERN